MKFLKTILNFFNNNILIGDDYIDKDNYKIVRILDIHQSTQTNIIMIKLQGYNKHSKFYYKISLQSFKKRFQKL